MEKITMSPELPSPSEVRRAYLTNYVNALKTLLSHRESKTLTLEERVHIQAEIFNMEHHIANHLGVALYTETRIDSIINLNPNDHVELIRSIQERPVYNDFAQRNGNAFSKLEDDILKRARGQEPE